LHPLAKILTNKYIRYPKYFIYGLLIVWDFNYLVRTDREMQEKVARYRELNREVVPDKPAMQFTIPGYAWLFDPAGDATGDTLGYIRQTMLYANADQGDSRWVDGRIFFWIWAESVLEGQLICDETIRDRANAFPLGELKGGTVIEEYYLNGKKSWLLASCDVRAKNESLRTFSQHLNDKRLLKPQLHVTSTNRQAGIAMLPRTHILQVEDLKTPIRVTLFIAFHFMTLFVIVMLITARHRDAPDFRKRFLLRMGLIAGGILCAFILMIIIP